MSTPNVKQDGSTTFVEYDGNVNQERQSNPDLWRQPGTLEVGPNGAVDHGPITHNTIDTPSGIDTGEIMSTVRGAQGQNISSHGQINDECSVVIGGIKTSVGNALRLGYIQKDAQGNFYDSNAPQPEPVKKDNNREIPFDPAMSAHIDGLKQLHGADVVDSLMSRAISDLAQKKDATATVKELSDTLGFEPENGLAIADGILIRLQEAMFHAVETQFNEDGDDVADWFHNKLSADMKAHFMVRGYHGDRTAIRDMVRIFKAGDHY